MTLPRPIINVAAIRTNDPVGLVVGIRRNFSASVHGPSATADRFGRADRAYLFDGVDDYIQLNSESLLASPKFTLVVSFKLLSLPLGGPVVASPQAGVYAYSEKTLVAKGGSYAIQINREGGASYCHLKICCGDWNTIYRDERLMLNTYYQVAASYADGNLRIAFNGVLRFEEANVPVPVINTESLVIGNRLNSNYPEYFNGVIDEVQVYDRPLTNEEINHLYQSGSF